MSDLEYLRSKMASGIDDNFSDSEDDHSIDNDADQNYHSRSSGNDSESSDNDSMGDNNKDENPYGQNDATETNDYEADDDFEDNSRLFVKNLPYTCIEEEVRELFEGFGVINEVHLPIDKEKKTKGYGFVTFLIPEQAIKSMNELNGSSWQGRVLRITMAEKKKSVVSDGNTNDTKNFLSTYQQKREDERKKNLHSKEGWNASFVRSDTVVDTLAERLDG